MKEWKLIVILVTLFYQIAFAGTSTLQLGLILHHRALSKPGVLTAYVTRLIQTKCQRISEFNILSTNPQSLEISNLQQYAKKSPILLNFDFKSIGQADFRYRIPKSSRAELFYIGNIDLNETCEELGSYLVFAEAHMSAGIIPLVGEEDQTSVITVDNSLRNIFNYFGYGHNPNHQHFQIVENIRLISRHTMNLAQSSIRQIQLMQNNLPPACEQIMLNFVVAHFYPEMRSRIYKFVGKLSPLEFSKQASVKANCIKSFIQTLGYCPLYYQRKVFSRGLWKNPHFDQIVALKKVALDTEIFSTSPQKRLLVSPQEQLVQYAYFFNISPFEQIIIMALILILLFLVASVAFLKGRIKAQMRKHSGCAVVSFK